MDILLGILEQGLIYGILALGLYITYRILDFPDLTVDGSFPLGAAVTAYWLSGDRNPVLSLPLSFAAGLIAGTLTGLIHVKLKVRDLLSGIIMMTALYTVNLGIAGKANVPIFKRASIFQNGLSEKLFTAGLSPWKTLIIVLLIVLVLKILLDLYLETSSGFLLKAAGDNPVLVKTLGRDPGTVKILGLAMANGLVALAGSVLCQQQRFFDITMGTGSMVIGLASVIIGIKLFSRLPKIKTTTAVLLGSIIYKACVATAIAMGLPANSLKLITAALFLLILVLSSGSLKKKVFHD